jgi:hypothetical protein
MTESTETIGGGLTQAAWIKVKNRKHPRGGSKKLSAGALKPRVPGAVPQSPPMRRQERFTSFHTSALNACCSTGASSRINSFH